MTDTPQRYSLDQYTMHQCEPLVKMPFFLLHVPAELRLLIYDFLFPHDDGYPNLDWLKSLRLSCRLVKAEINPKIVAAAHKHFQRALEGGPGHLSFRPPSTFKQALVLQLPVSLDDLDSSLGTIPEYYMWQFLNPTRQWGWLFEILNRLDKHVRVVQLHVQPLPAKRWRRLYEFCHKVCYRLSPREEHSSPTRVEEWTNDYEMGWSLCLDESHLRGLQEKCLIESV
jgi:hypothetical protein